MHDHGRPHTRLTWVAQVSLLPGASVSNGRLVKEGAHAGASVIIDGLVSVVESANKRGKRSGGVVVGHCILG